MTVTRFLLSERTNPHAPSGWWGYPSRRGTVTAVVVHTAETDPSPGSALNVARWQAYDAPTASSYHVIVDSDHTVRTVLDTQTAFHVRDFNSPSLGLSFATRASMWGRYPVWDDQALSRAGTVARQWRNLHVIPARWLTRTEALAGVKGFVRHSVMDPTRRSDPGVRFPADRFLELAAGKQPDPEVDDMLLTRIDSSAAVYQPVGRYLFQLNSAEQAAAIVKVSGASGRWQDHVANLSKGEAAAFEIVRDLPSGGSGGMSQVQADGRYLRQGASVRLAGL